MDTPSRRHGGYSSVQRQIKSTKELTGEPWRKQNLVFSEACESELKKEVEQPFTAMEGRVRRANILLLGPIKSGKSSFLNSVASICKGRIAKVVRTGEAEKSLTTQYDKFAPKTGSMKNFCLLDCMGIEGEGDGFNVGDIISLVNGHVPRNYKFNPVSPITVEYPGYIREPREKDKVHCVVIVVDAEALYGDIPQELKKKIKELKNRLDEIERQQFVILTKIDKLCKKVNEDITYVYKSAKVFDMVKSASELFGLPLNQIFPIKNYSNETEIDFKLHIPILLALKMIVSTAADFIAHQEDVSSDED